MQRTTQKSELKLLKRIQKNEGTEAYLYHYLAKREKREENQRVFEKLAQIDETHVQFWKRYTKVEIKPNWVAIFFSLLFVRLLGITFTLKFIEKGEEKSKQIYEKLSLPDKEMLALVAKEQEEEKILIDVLSEEKLKYMGAIVLGLNDALVELTGALAGFTFALQDTKLIAIAGLVTGVAASLSMASSNYLAEKTEKKGENSPLKSAFYTGIAYLLTVVVLVLPYLFLANFYIALIFTLLGGACIIAVFNYYYSITRSQPFFHRFFEMISINVVVSLISFGIGYLLRTTLKI